MNQTVQKVENFFVNTARTLLSNGLIRAIVLGQARHWLGVGSATLLVWLQTNGVQHDAATQLTGDIIGAVGLALTALLQVLDAKGVDTKIKTALTADPTTSLTAIDALKSGSF